MFSVLLEPQKQFCFVLLIFFLFNAKHPHIFFCLF
ncbi:hypothetical protein Nmel_006705 [Mimus melanotis]